MKKTLTSLLVVILTIGVVAGCAKKATPSEDTYKDTDSTTTSTDSKDKETEKYADGIYFAAGDSFGDSGWKSVVTLEVKDGKIVSADWNGASINGGDDKKTTSKNGAYGLVEKGNGQSEWHEQAEAAENFLLEKQDPTAITYNDEGKTDDIAGVSIYVTELFTLAEKALANGPTGSGNWKDGAYHGEDEDFNEKTGWKATFDATVINGFIVAANWNGLHKDGGDDKKKQVAAGNYTLANDGGKTWTEQAALVEAKLLETQDPTAVTVKEDGSVDDIAGVSVKAKEFFTIAEKVLEAR